MPTAQPIIINHHLWSTADRDAELISFVTRKHGTFKHASEASFFELAPALMHGLGVPNWQPDEYAFGRILRFFFMALPGAADVDASMYAEVAYFHVLKLIPPVGCRRSALTVSFPCHALSLPSCLSRPLSQPLCYLVTRRVSCHVREKPVRGWLQLIRPA